MAIPTPQWKYPLIRLATGVFAALLVAIGTMAFLPQWMQPPQHLTPQEAHVREYAICVFVVAAVATICCVFTTDRQHSPAAYGICGVLLL